MGIRLEPVDGTDLASAPWVRVVQENGSATVFTLTGDGSYTAPNRVLATLRQEADGSFVFVRKNVTTFVFGSDGALKSVSDRNGNALHLSYEEGQLSRIEVQGDASQYLTVTWAEGRIAAVADQSGRSLEYVYSAEGDLVKVLLPDGGELGYTYDSAHRVVTMVNALGGVTTNAYDSAGRVISQEDPVGRITSFVYGSAATTVTAPDGTITIDRYSDGQLTSVTRAAGTAQEATTTYVYGFTNQATSVTDPLGKVTQYAYDAHGNVISTTDPLGRIATATYGEFNNHLTVTDPAGGVTTFEYDDRGNPVQRTDADGGVTTYSVNPDGTVAAATDPLGRVTTYTYDSYGYPATATGPDGSTVSTEYDSLGRVVSSIDPLGRVTSYAYDAAGRTTELTDPLGGVTQLEFDASGNLTRSVDATGLTATFAYDLAGQLIESIDVAGAATSYAYDTAGRLVSVTDADGTTSSEYDAAGNLVAVTDPLGRVTEYDYDLLGQVVSMTTPSGKTSSYAYDAAGQLTSTTNPDGGVEATAYDAAGRPAAVTDADGRAATVTYDAMGRMVETLRADGSLLTWAYDAAGQLTSYTDAAGSTTSYAYNAAGRVAARTDPAGRVTAYSYDAAGNPVQTVLADGGSIGRAYDALNRVVGIDYSDDTPDVGYSYDAVGRRLSMLDGTGTTSYSYASGRLTEVAAPGGTVGYEWAIDGDLLALTYPDGQQVTYDWDAADQLVTVEDWAGGVYEYSYDADGKASSLTYPNGVTSTLGSDEAGRVSGIAFEDSAGTTLLDIAYEYSAAGLMTSQSTMRSGGTRAAGEVSAGGSGYVWDALGRLDEVTGTGAGDVGFTVSGQVASLPDGRALSYDAADQLAAVSSGDGSVGFSFDARGNRVTSTSGDEVTSYGYDLDGRLVEVSDPQGAVTTNVFDGDGLRSSTTITDGDATTFDEFVWASLGEVPVVVADAEWAYVYGAGTVPLAQLSLEDGTAEYLHADLIGSVRLVTDAAGAILAEADWDPYGLLVVGSEGTATGGVEDLAGVTSFGFAGEWVDASGLVYLRARFYDPVSAQFLTPDVLVDLTRDVYGYTGGNPLQFTDPLGLDWYNPVPGRRSRWIRPQRCWVVRLWC